jgi:MFS family permease
MSNSTLPRPATPRQPGAVQGWVLVSSVWLSVMANMVLAPVLPTMTARFQGQPHLDLLISLTATLPALFVALLGAPFGALADRIGHKRVLLTATLAYGVVGTAPLWLETLPQIVVSRALVGVTEAAVLTCSTALIVGYFSGATRERYFALQTGSASVVAVVVSFLGGVLGASSWRAPFWMYGFAFLQIPLTAWLLWEPVGKRHGEAGPAGTHDTGGQATAAMRWGPFLGVCAVTVVAMTAFMAAPVQSSFALSERGLTAPAAIGLWVSLAVMTQLPGSLLYSALRWPTLAKLALAFALLAAGLSVMAFVGSWQYTVAGAALANLGGGMIVPTLLTWALSGLAAEHRGRGSGTWFSACFLGQFLGPLCVLGLRQLTGSLAGALGVIGIGCAVAAALSLAGQKIRGRWPDPGAVPQ